MSSVSINSNAARYGAQQYASNGSDGMRLATKGPAASNNNAQVAEGKKIETPAAVSTKGGSALVQSLNQRQTTVNISDLARSRLEQEGSQRLASGGNANLGNQATSSVEISLDEETAAINKQQSAMNQAMAGISQTNAQIEEMVKQLQKALG